MLVNLFGDTESLFYSISCYFDLEKPYEFYVYLLLSITLNRKSISIKNRITWIFKIG